MKNADIIFMTYNYILDQSIASRFTDLNLSKSILIIDEGHNVANVAEDTHSAQFNEFDIMLTYKDIKRLEDGMASKKKPWVKATLDDTSYIRKSIDKVKAFMLNPK